MKIKYIALLTLTSVALSGCSDIQALANAADSALGAVNNGLDRLNVALGGESHSSSSGESEAVRLLNERRRLSWERINIQYFQQNETQLTDLFRQWLLYSINDNTYTAIANELNEYNQAIAAQQQGKSTYQPPQYYDVCTHYIDAYINGGHAYRNCHEAVTLRYTAAERREIYADTIARYNQYIAEIQKQRAQFIGFINQKDDGKEIPFDAPAAMQKISGLNAEAKQYREAKEAAEAKLKAFDVIEDAAAALKAG